MVSRFRMTKNKEYPLPHDLSSQFQVNIDATAFTTHFPIMNYDEAIIPSAIITNPENASFVEIDDPNIAEGSKVFNIQATMRVSLTKHFATTDNLTAIRFAFMTHHGAFEDFDANDELSSATVGDILELTKETTDRQTFPIWDGAGQDTTTKFTGSNVLGSNQQGLLTPFTHETTTFDPDLYYDAINHFTNAKMIQKVSDGLRWITLTRDNPTRLFKFRITSNVKASNPFSYFGLMLHVPNAGTKYQLPTAGDTTSVNHLMVEMRARYLEWNSGFTHDRVTA